MTKKMAWSFSRLNDFEQCPRMFHQKYILKQWPKQDDSPHLVRGRRVHDKLEAAVKQAMVRTNGAYDEEIYAAVPLIMQLTTHARDNGAQVLTEQQKALTERLTETGWFEKNVWVRAIFDLAIIYDDYALNIDWKTGKIQEDKGQNALFSAVIMALHPNVKKVITAFIYVDHNNTPVRKVYTRDQYDELWNELGDRAELIQIAVESGHWPAKENRNCKWCHAHCEFRK